MLYNLEDIIKYIMLLRKEVYYTDPETNKKRLALVKEVVIDSTFSVHLTLIFITAEGVVIKDIPPIWVYDLSLIEQKKSYYDDLINSAIKKIDW